VSFSVYVAIPALRLNGDINKLNAVEKLVGDLQKWNIETAEIFSGKKQAVFDYLFPIDVVGRLYSEILK